MVSLPALPHTHHQGKLFSTALTSLPNITGIKSQGRPVLLFHTLRAGSSELTQTGPALLCCPGNVWGLLSQVLQLLRVRDSLPTLMPQRAAISPVADGKGGGGGRRASFPCHHMADDGEWSQLSHSHTFRAGSQRPKQGQIYYATQARCRVCSSMCYSQ